MQTLSMEIVASQVSAELQRRGVPMTPVRVVVEIPDNPKYTATAIAQTGGAFDWLADEPDLYSDKDLLPHTP